MSFTHCLAYAGNKFREITGESRPRPSTGNYPGEYWNNARQRTGSVRCPGVAIWVNNRNTNEGHALCVASYNSRNKTYLCYEANWDDKGKTRTIHRTADQIRNMYRSKIWKGCVY